MRTACARPFGVISKAMFSLVAPRATTVEAVLSLSMAICNITNDGTRREEVCLLLLQVLACSRNCQHVPTAGSLCTTEESVQWLAAAIGSITMGTTQTTKDAFATPAMSRMHEKNN